MAEEDAAAEVAAAEQAPPFQLPDLGQIGQLGQLGTLLELFQNIQAAILTFQRCGFSIMARQHKLIAEILVLWLLPSFHFLFCNVS